MVKNKTISINDISCFHKISQTQVFMVVDKTT